MPPEKTRGARPRDEGDAADLVESQDLRDSRARGRGPVPIDAARATSPNSAYLRPVAPLDRDGQARPDAPPGDDRATQNVVKPFVRGLPEDPALDKLRAGGAGARGQLLRIAVIVVLAAAALWLVLS